jgi:hypothetical protein
MGEAHVYAAAVASVAEKTVKWKEEERNELAKLAEADQYYSHSSSVHRTLCPDSGATSTMCPHRDMFRDYVDLRSKGRVVRLGDDNKTIPILGQGTMCITIEGRNIALANTLYVPDLSAILLSSRVLRRIAPGCSFVADHKGCFLTFPNFTFEINDETDCTLQCQKTTSDKFDFDSRLFLPEHASRTERHRRHVLKAN